MKYLLASLLLSASAWSMGNRPPTDPATYQDITDAENQTTNETGRALRAETSLTAQQQATAAQQKADEDRIDQMDQTKILLEGAVRVLDTKRFAVELFNDYDARRAQDFAFGAKVTLKLGKSYEERQLDKQQKEIDALRELLFKKDIK
jgi:hypothetical protein